MDESALSDFRTLLQNWRNQLLNQADYTVTNLLNTYRRDEADPLDWASIETEQNFHLRIRDRERRLVKKITEALRRIDEGEFGICEMCGQEIALQRLRARPVSNLLHQMQRGL